MKSNTAFTGFTLVELMVAIAILAITLAVGIPAMNTLRNTMAVGETANNLANIFAYARGEAVARVTDVSVSRCEDDSCSFSVFVDLNGDCFVGDGDGITRVSPPLSDSLSVSEPTACFTFDSLGQTTLPDDIEFEVKDKSSDEIKKIVTVFKTGLVSIKKPDS